MRINEILKNDSITAGITLVDIDESGAYVDFRSTIDDVANHFKIQLDKVVHIQQVHGDDIVEARLGEILTADGLVTNDPDLVIGVKVADCCGIVLYDPVTGARAAVHSGWRGTVKNIAARGVEALVDTYGASPLHIHAGLSPCASQQQYQVGREVFEVLGEWCQPDGSTDEKWLYNNQAAITDQLLGCGLKAENVQRDRSCSITDSRYHSYRRDGEKSGRNFVFIGTMIAGVKGSRNP